MSRKVISSESAPKAIGPYSQAIAVEGKRMVFFSGQIPLDPVTGEVVTGDVRAQTRRVLDNIAGVLAAADVSMDAVVKTTVPFSAPVPNVEEAEQQQGMLQAVSTAQSFKLLGDLGAEADGWLDPGRSEVMKAVRERTAELCRVAADMGTLLEARTLIKALGSPELLKKAYNERLAVLRQPQEMA